MIHSRVIDIQKRQVQAIALGLFCFFVMELDFGLKFLMQESPNLSFNNLIEFKHIYNYSSIFGFLSSIWKSSFIHTKRALLMIIFGAPGAIYAINRDILKLDAGDITQISLKKNDFHQDSVKKINDIVSSKNSKKDFL